MYARNFVETDNHFFHPRIDDNAGGTGILVLEAPLMYYGMYLLSIPFGYQHWYGRLINLVVSSGGIYFFFLLVKRFFTSKIAFYASLMLLTSIWFAFSRKTMQDTFAISLIIMAIYFCIQYLEETGHWKHLIYYILLSSLAILAKIPAIIYLIFPFLFILKYKPKQQKVVAWTLGSILPVALSYLWYFVYAPYASKTYGYWHNLGERFSDGLQSLISDWKLLIQRFFYDGIHSFVFMLLFGYGLYLILKRKQKLEIVVLGSITFVFFLFMIKSGKYFMWHNYYMIPYVPIYAIVAAIALSYIKNNKIVTAILIIGMTEAVASQAFDFTNSPNEDYKLKLTAYSNQFTKQDEKIVLVNYGNPIEFYFAHRKGWLQTEKEKLPEEKLQQLWESGAKILIINRRYVDHTYELPLLKEDTDYRIYQLE